MEPLEEYISRDAGREHPVGEQVIRKTWQRYLVPRGETVEYLGLEKRQET